MSFLGSNTPVLSISLRGKVKILAKAYKALCNPAFHSLWLHLLLSHLLTHSSYNCPVLFWEDSRYTPASGPLHFLFPQPGMISQIFMWLSLSHVFLQITLSQWALPWLNCLKCKPQYLTIPLPFPCLFSPEHKLIPCSIYSSFFNCLSLPTRVEAPCALVFCFELLYFLVYL